MTKIGDLLHFFEKKFCFLQNFAKFEDNFLSIKYNNSEKAFVPQFLKKVLFFLKNVFRTISNHIIPYFALCVNAANEILVPYSKKLLPPFWRWEKNDIHFLIYSVCSWSFQDIIPGLFVVVQLQYSQR